MTPPVRAGRRARRLIGNALLLAGAAGLVLAGLSLLTLSREEALDRGGRTGTADVVACRRVGPVSGSGLGYWWSCDVVVRWDDGESGRYDVPGSLFRPADRDRAVPVREVLRGGRGNLDAAARLARVDRPARLGLLAAGLVALLAGGLCGLRPVSDLVRLLARLALRITGRGVRSRSRPGHRAGIGWRRR